NALVFSIILGVILGANLLVLRVLPRPPFRVLYLLIGATLALQYLWPVASWVTGPGPMGYAAATVYLGAPIFLAAIVFAGSFRVAVLGTAALASNLLGAVLGGTAEYLSLVWGIRALTLVAMAMYTASYVFWEVRSARRPAVERDLAAV
ncbi:MAG TPA: spermidine synthase, partial [Acidimicrobiia bacterium]